jgi:tetratricopeptide (TPR) repeat protein
VLWIPLQGPFIRLLAMAAERALPLVEHPPILTALATRGNSITCHSYITGAPQPLTQVNFESLHLTVVASLALALAVSARRWSARAKVCGLSLVVIFFVMLAVCIVQLQWAAEGYASTHLGITLYTAREKEWLDLAMRKSSFAAVYLVPALLILTSYLAVWSGAGSADAPDLDKQRGPASGSRPSLHRRFRSASIALAACVGAGLLLVATQGDREGGVSLEGLRKIVALNPASPRAHFSLALNLEQEGSLDEAMASYRSALHLRPDFMEARLGEGNVFFRKGAYDQAAICYEDVLQRQPDNSDARYNLGTTFLNRGIFDLAAQSYEAVLGLRPDHAAAHKGLGEALLRLDRRCDALPHLERSAALDRRLAADAALLANISILRSNCGRPQ